MTQPASRRYEQVLAAAMEKPWAILPAKLALIAEVIALRLSDRRYTDEEIEARVGPKPKRGGTATGSVQVIGVYGSIMPRGSSFNDVSGGQSTSMEEFIKTIDQAAGDGNVTNILLDIDSPGGQVDMVPEAAAALRRARNEKPVVAVANTTAASAAYWLASQASELVVTPSGEIGSIGVFALHNDLSEQLKMLGITPTIIKAGKYKTELSPFHPLSEEAAAAAQKGVDTFYDMFTKDVATGRGAPVASVRSGFGEGRMVTAKEAVAEGMADRVDTFDNTLARLMRGGAVTRPVQAEDDDVPVLADGGFVLSRAQARALDQAGSDLSAEAEAGSDEGASVEEALGSMPQDSLAALRLRSRATVVSERETYLSLLRRIST